MNWTKGLCRAVLVVSIIALILGFSIYARYSSVYEPDDKTFVEVLGFGCICLSAVCLIYFAVLWIVKGFRDEDKQETQEVNRELI